MKRLVKKICFLQRDDSGAVIIVVALLLVVLMGMAALAVDGGTLYQNRRNMVNAADAAALAGAQELIFVKNHAAVEKFARDFAIDNYGCDPDLVVAKVINPYTVGVSTGRNVNLNFAGVLGIGQSDVTAYAEAQFTPLVLAANIVPWGVPAGFLPLGWKDDICPWCGEPKIDCDCCQFCGELLENCICEAGDEYIILKVGPPGGGGPKDEIGPGNFHALALSGPGAAEYEDDIKHGYDGEITIGACLVTQTGNIAGKTGTGVEYRIDQCNHTQKTNGICDDRSCARFVVTPVFDEAVTDVQGKGCVKVIAFATFYLVDYYKEGSTHIVRALYVEEFIGEGLGSGDYDATIDFGTYNLRLIE